MAKKSTTQSGALTQEQLAKMFGVGTQQFRKKYQPLIPQKLVVQSGSRKRFKPQAVRAIVDALVADERERLTLESDDALMLSGDSARDPELRRLRMAKAQLAELDLEERRGQLVSIEAAGQVLQIAASQIRRAGELIGRKYGAEAQEILEAAIAEGQSEMESVFGADGPSET